MIEVPLVKRAALHKGEIGLFPVDPVSDEEIKRMPDDGAPLWAEITTPHNIKLQRLLWAIAYKLAQGGLYLDKDEAMTDLKIRARHAEFVSDKGRLIVKPRSLSRLGRAELSRLAERFIFIVCSELLPEMMESDFRAELEDMLG